jgi:hypothetical protein
MAFEEGLRGNYHPDKLERETPRSRGQEERRTKMTGKMH